MKSRLVVMPSDELSSPSAERGQIMEKNVNLSNVATANLSSLNYPHPYFVPIDDGDEETIKFYKRNDVPVAHIALPGRMKHYYAVFNADTQADADLMNRTYNNWAKKDARDKAAQKEFETSYDVMVENGYDAKDDINNPENRHSDKNPNDTSYDVSFADSVNSPANSI